MWITVNQVFSRAGSQDVWAHLAGSINAWKRVKTGSADGVTNICTLLASAKASNKQAYVVIASDVITEVYL